MSLLEQAAGNVEKVNRSKGGRKAYIAFERDEDEQHGIIVSALERAAHEHSIKRNPLGIQLLATALVEAGYLEQDPDTGEYSTPDGSDEVEYDEYEDEDDAFDSAAEL